VPEFVTTSEEETARLAGRVATELSPGDVLLLSGNLGAGKTAFVRGLAAGLGVDPDEVSSPTFTLIQEYRGGPVPLYHVDLYRLGPAEVPDLGLEALAADGVLAIEWADRLPDADGAAVRVVLEQTGHQTRQIAIHWPR
jgi:tRNA threonylcarbamoyladenosine biosynthesis protein TsaE